MRPAPGDRGVYFLVPSAEVPGAMAFVQEDSERLAVEADADAAVDAFMRKLLEAPGAPAELWLEGLATTSPSIVAHSARKLAERARQGALASADWERLLSFLSSDKLTDEAKAGVVAALGGAIPSDRTLALLAQAPEGSRLKSALLAAMAQRGSAGVSPEKARKAIGAAAKDASPEVVLAAAQGLAALGDEAALPELDRALKSGDASARQAAVESLAKLATQGSRRARSRLQSLFDDADGLVRARARNAWADAYLNDPMRLQRTRASLWFVGIALALLVAAGIYSWVDRRRG
jgi:HEAT repeat protein